MPGRNRKGPSGEGAMTGRGMGRCNPNNKTNTKENQDSQMNQLEGVEMTPEPEFEWGMGRGMGRGMRNGMRYGRRRRDSSGDLGRGMGWGMGRGNRRGNQQGNGRGIPR